MFRIDTVTPQLSHSRSSQRSSSYLYSRRREDILFYRNTKWSQWRFNKNVELAIVVPKAKISIGFSVQRISHSRKGSKLPEVNPVPGWTNHALTWSVFAVLDHTQRFERYVVKVLRSSSPEWTLWSTMTKIILWTLWAFQPQRRPFRPKDFIDFAFIGQFNPAVNSAGYSTRLLTLIGSFYVLRLFASRFSEY